MAVELVASSTLYRSETSFSSTYTFDYAQALAASENAEIAGAVAVLVLTLRNSSAIQSVSSITIGGVAADVSRTTEAVGEGTGYSYLIVAACRLEGLASDDVVISSSALSEVDVVVQGAVFCNVDADFDFATAVELVEDTGVDPIGPVAVLSGGVVIAAGCHRATAEVTYASDEGSYTMVDGGNLTYYNPTSDGNTQVQGFGYRLATVDATAESADVTNSAAFSPGIIFFMPAIAAAADPFNCTCEDETNYRTLAELRTDIIRRLGFVEQKAVVAGKTLLQLKTYLMTRLGFAAQLASPPPGMAELLTELVNEAQDTLWRTYAYDVQGGTAPTALAADGDTLTLDSMAVQLLALANAKSHYGQDAKPFYEQFDAYLKGLLQRSPLNLSAIVTSFLQDAQRQLYRRYNALRTERFYRWTMVAGERFYDLPDNDDECTKELDAYKITWVGVEDLNGTWYTLSEGIHPTLYTSVNQPGLPARYEVRQCIEVFPAPDQAYTLRVKGHFWLEAFAADGDKTTIDDQAVFLLALAQAKAHYQQPDAQNYFSQASNHIGSLVAGAHHTARYIPRSAAAAPQPQPRMVAFDDE